MVSAYRELTVVDLLHWHLIHLIYNPLRLLSQGLSNCMHGNLSCRCSMFVFCLWTRVVNYLFVITRIRKNVEGKETIIGHWFICAFCEFLHFMRGFTFEKAYFLRRSASAWLTSDLKGKPLWQEPRWWTPYDSSTGWVGSWGLEIWGHCYKIPQKCSARKRC